MFQALYNNFFKKEETNTRIDEELKKVINDIKYISVIETLDNFDKQLFYNKLTEVYPAAFSYIDQKYHTLNMCESVTNKIPDLIKYCKYQTIDMCKKVVNKKPQLIKYCIYKTPDMVRKAIDTDYKLIENSGADIQYFFDNDEAGFIKSEEKIKQGFPVFLWKKLFEDIVDKNYLEKLV